MAFLSIRECVSFLVFNDSGKNIRNILGESFTKTF